MNYLVKRPFFERFRRYGVGELIDLTPERAVQLGDSVEVVNVAISNPPMHRAITNGTRGIRNRNTRRSKGTI